MELLVALIAELLIAALLPVIAILGSVLAAAIELILVVILGLRGKRPRQKDDMPRPARVTPRQRRGLRMVLLAPVVLILGGLVVANQFFFAPTVRWAADFAASRAGYLVEIGTVAGNLWTGELELERLLISGQTDDLAATSVSARLVDIDLAVTSLLSRTVRLDRLTVDDLDVVVRKQASAPSDDRNPQKTIRSFAVEALAVTDAEMVVENFEGQRHILRITKAQAAPLRSRSAAFDLLFRSNLDATVGGTDLTVKTSVIDGDGRRTEWEIDALDLRSLAAFTDAAPVRWLDGGTVSARMQDEWRRDDLTIDSAWQINLRNAVVAVPDGAGMTETILVRALAKVAEAKRGDIDLSFRLMLDEDGFRDNASDDLSAWWAAMVKGIARAIAERENADAAETEDRLQGFTQGVRNLLGLERQQ